MCDHSSAVATTRLSCDPGGKQATSRLRDVSMVSPQQEKLHGTLAVSVRLVS
jgi:hypothetical protein